RRRTVLLRDDPDRAQLLLHEELRPLRVEAATDTWRDVLADCLVAPLAVDGLGDRVEQSWHLDHLAVTAAHDVRRLLEPRVGVLPDQLDAVCEPRHDIGLRLVGRRPT